MSWSILFTCFLEMSEESVQTEKRKADRMAEKKRQEEAEKSGGAMESILGRTIVESFDVHGKMESALKKIWSSNAAWCEALLVDALSFIKTHRARSKESVNRALKGCEGRSRSSQAKSQSELFAQNVWPALRLRGWSTEDVESNGSVSKRYRKGTHVVSGVLIFVKSVLVCYCKSLTSLPCARCIAVFQFKTASQVMNAVPAVHPELKAMILDVQESMKSIEKDKAVVLDFKDLSSSAKMNSHVLKLLLHHFAPLQFLVDRSSTKKLSFFPKKMLSTCLCISNAHIAVRESSGELFSKESIDGIADRLSLMITRCQLPHPKWTTTHDAVLMSAIKKHGWVEHDTVNRAIFDDKSIRWGPPFEYVSDGSSPTKVSQSQSTSKDSKMAEVELDAIEKAAERAAKFLTTEQELICALREFREDHLVRVYALDFQASNDKGGKKGSGPSSQSMYVVNSAKLKGGAGKATKEDKTESASEGEDVGEDVGGSTGNDFPTKKDLLKRAKGILSRELPTKPAHAPSKIAGGSGSLTEQHKHNYHVIDKDVRSNAFLLELLQSLVKVSLSNSEKRKAIGRKLMAYSLQEVIKRKEDLNVMCGALGDSEDHSKIVDGMNRVFEHLDEVSNTVEKHPIQGKNVLRAMLGMKLVKPKNESFGLFPASEGIGKLTIVGGGKKENSEESSSSTWRMRKASKPKKSKDTGSIGDRGLSLAMTRAKEEMDGKGKISADARRGYLELTALETLLLTVVCSQGLPVWTNDWVDLVLPSDGVQPEIQGFGFQNAISWHGMGYVFESAASVWYEAAKAKVDHYRLNFEEIYAQYPDGDQVKEREKKRLEVLEWELKSRKVALAVARNYNNDSLALAKKTIMLLEVIRSRMGNVDSKRGTNVTKIRKQNKSEFGLGPIVLHWLSKEIERWAESLELTDVSGRPIAYSAIDYAEEGSGSSSPCGGLGGDSGASGGGQDLLKPAALMDKKGCRHLMIQIAQQTRIRSIWLKNGEAGIKKKLLRAAKSCNDLDDHWTDQPSWWGDKRTIYHDLMMMDSLLQSGYSGIEDKMSAGVKVSNDVIVNLYLVLRA